MSGVAMLQSEYWSILTALWHFPIYSEVKLTYTVDNSGNAFISPLAALLRSTGAEFKLYFKEKNNYVWEYIHVVRGVLRDDTNLQEF